MPANYFTISILLALCLGQNANTSPVDPQWQETMELQQKAQALLGQFQNNAQLFALNASGFFQGIKNRINQTISKLHQVGEDFNTCITSEKGNISLLVNQAEKQAKSCASDISTEMAPYVEHLSNTTHDVVALIQVLAPSFIQCSASISNPVTAALCFGPVIIQHYGEIQVIIKEVSVESSNIQEAVKVLTPQLDNCREQFQSSAEQLNALMKEVESCIKQAVTKQNAAQ